MPRRARRYQWHRTCPLLKPFNSFQSSPWWENSLKFKQTLSARSGCQDNQVSGPVYRGMYFIWRPKPRSRNPLGSYSACNSERSLVRLYNVVQVSDERLSNSEIRNRYEAGLVTSIPKSSAIWNRGPPVRGNLGGLHNVWLHWWSAEGRREGFQTFKCPKGIPCHRYAHQPVRHEIGDKKPRASVRNQVS